MLVAGGTDIIHLMKNAIISPAALVNIKTIPNLTGINKSVGGLTIGALTKIHDIVASPVIKAEYPMLAQAAHSIASPQIRNMATIGGNLCQQVRCWYYRMSPHNGQSFFCRRKGGQKCYAVAGINTYHAVIGGSTCYAVCPSDLAPALVALSGALKITGPDGDRTVPLDEFYTTMGNVLHASEIITDIHVPLPRNDTKQRFIKFRTRKAIDFAIASVAATVSTQEGLVSQIRIVLGGIAPVPYQAIGAAEYLKGKLITESVAEAAAELAVSETKPLSMNEYKVSITKAIIKRALLE
jgi:xanthine dehydrogenase YagS FAD-binding subunit